MNICAKKHTQMTMIMIMFCSHKKWRALIKKQKRKAQRQAQAKQKENLEDGKGWFIKNCRRRTIRDMHVPL